MQTAPSAASAVPEPIDQTLATAVDLAREALLEDVPAVQVGGHLGVVEEPSGFGFAATHRFAASLPGYVGWDWAVSIARAPGGDPTVSEVVLLPGDGSIRPSQWIPWADRLRPEDLHPGDVVPSDPDDERLAPGYTLSDDPQVEAVAWELGLGRERVLSREGRLDAAARWRNGTRGGQTAMARHAPAGCGTCGFYLPLAGSLQGMFGACANEISPADGQVVSADYGCGAHSDATANMNVELAARGEVIYDTVRVDLARLARGRGELSPERRERARVTLTAVLADAAVRLQKQETESVVRLTPAQVMHAVRVAFAARTKPTSTDQVAHSPRLSRTKR
ncbi:DUF3027 domain-containing protein [Blastococcus sp. Marseille-P5729]|uniref:DUF3027 domain-containing protein n=1 Tax=Blastococcus sp. Marseille-P5729 TaxID=2086582 RepID=UPI0018FF081D|nr:DUF3027 domain-containing protein [Blastococcus sp. Marseille-P5729]